MQRKSVVAVLLVVLLGGCLSTLPPPPPPPHKGVVLTVACPPELKELVAARSRVWASRQQAEVVTSEVSRRKRVEADIEILAPAELPSRAARGELVRLPKALAAHGNGFDWAGLLPQYREQLLLWDGVPFAVPLVGEAPLCAYRSDLFAANQAAYRAWQKKRNEARAARKEEPPVRDLGAPRTWEEFADQAEFFRDHLGRPSLPPLPAGEPDLDRLFFTVAASYARRAVRAGAPAGEDHLEDVFSFHYDQQSGEARIASAGFVAALALLQRLQACRPKEALAAPEMLFLEGKAVLCLTEASWLVRFQNRADLRDRFGVCPVPGSDRVFTKQGRVRPKGVNWVPYLGGAGRLAVVPASSGQQEAALDLLADLAGPAASQQTALEPRWGGPTRTDQVLRERWDAFDLDAARTRALKEALTSALLQDGEKEYSVKNPAWCLRIPDQSAHRALLVDQLKAALTGGKSVDKALQDAAKGWAALDEKPPGKEAHRRAYRISLGLLGP